MIGTSGERSYHISRIPSVVVCFWILSAIVSPSPAATFYVDPSSGSPRGNGSAQQPWRTLQEVIDSGLIESREGTQYPYTRNLPLRTRNSGAPVKAGDTLLLRSGHHGAVTIQRYYNTEYVTLAAQKGHRPLLSSMKLSAVEKWRVLGLTISPEAISPYRRTTLFTIESHANSGPTSLVEAAACTLYSVNNASGWTMRQWDTLSCNGFSVSGTRVQVRNNYLRNVNFGISVSGDSCLVERNTVENFAGDGLRGLGNYDVFAHNTVMNCYDVNANHDDGFQSWSVGTGGVGTGVVRGMRLIGNTIVNYIDPNQPFRGTLQGIGCFDGFFEDWVVENNVVMTDHFHGITLAGARNCRIINNTVCDLNSTSPGPPWISISSHKNGTASTGCTVRNNLSTAFQIEANQGVTNDHNLKISNPGDFFVSYGGRDLRLKPGCPAVDAGTMILAPAADILGTPRPQGATADVGAYEFAGEAIRIRRPARGGNHPGTIRLQSSGRGTIRVDQQFPSGELGVMTIHDLVGRRLSTMEFEATMRRESFHVKTERALHGCYIARIWRGDGPEWSGRVVAR